MASPQPQKLKQSPQQEQLSLPLNPVSTERLITPQEVWSTLSRPQQTRLFQHLVRVCCRLASAQLSEEVCDE